MMTASYFSSSLLIIVLIFSCVIFLSLASGEAETNEELLAITNEERKALEKFRPLVKDILTEEYQSKNGFLIRWLRAKKLDLNAAEKALREALEWRKANNIDTIMNETLMEGYTLQYNDETHDNDDRPVCITKFGKLDMRRMILNGKLKEMGRTRLQKIEIAMHKLQEYTNATGKEINQFVAIVDFAGFNIRQQGCLGCFASFLQFAKTEEKYYPNIRKYYVFINVPRPALPLAALVRPIISESSEKAAKIFETNKEEWSTFLKSIIPLNQLSVEYGGGRTDLKFT